MIKKILPFLIILLAYTSCIEQIDIKETTFEKLLVVEATLTNQLKIQTVKLSNTIELNSETPISETNAVVTITDSDQIIYNFTETSDGFYQSASPFKAELNKTYTLSINTSNGKTYESTPQKIEGTNEINEVFTKIETKINGDEGVGIFVKSNNTNNDAKYYRYTYKETYKITAPQWSEYRLQIVSDRPPYAVAKILHNEDRKICYNTITSKDIIQAESASLSENNIEKSVRFIPKNDAVITSRYSILIEQHVQSFEAYTYFNTLSKLSSSENVFTQNQPGFIPGNMYSKSNQEDKIVGFFEVTSVSSKRFFFNRDDIFPDQSIETPDYCQLIAPLLSERVDGSISSPLIEQLKRGSSYLYYADNPSPTDLYKGEYLLTPKKCGDCRELGTTAKPSFWVD
ncbi:DUF4249 domain-containing protein [Mesoflavibacter zeaxanthinifaciens]|uniref:DUF4249 domain-containing protein n=1 Tax=Mesoflavibacter zeaxanthinifaciens TaxID=393060 RepID=UPI003A910F6C